MAEYLVRTDKSVRLDEVLHLHGVHHYEVKRLEKHGDLIDRQAVLSYFETAFLIGADMDYEDIVGIVSNPKAIPTIVEATE